MKKLKQLDFKFFAAMLAGMAVIYVVTRYFLGSLYTPEWAARHIFTYVLSFLTVMSLLGYRKFVVTAITGYIAGLAAGELFGGFESHVGPQYLHWGWLILIIIFAVSCVAGYIIEKRWSKG